MPPHPTNIHQQAVGRLFRFLADFAQQSGWVRLAPLPVRLWPGKIREPDVLFVAREHQDRVGEQVFGPPDLVMEVTSATTQRTDRVEKYAEYARAGIPEYWIVDPQAETVEVFVLREDAYELLGKWGAGEVARSALLEGFRVEVNAVFAPESWERE
jgi:Uma2 family endonuclease